MMPHILLAAVYLRYYPHDEVKANLDRRAILRHAQRMGLQELVFYLDNGCRSSAPRPQLVRLIRHVQSGLYQLLFIPAPDVFSACRPEARDISLRLGAHGCQVRALAVPSRKNIGTVPAEEPRTGTEGSRTVQGSSPFSSDSVADR